MMTTVTSEMVGVMTTTKLASGTASGTVEGMEGSFVCYEKIYKKSETTLGNVLISLYCFKLK